jgi:hypothetical protein
VLCSDKVYTWTQSNAVYYSCQTASAISTNCPGELVFYAITDVYSCKTKAGIISTCGADATYKKTSPITFYQCVTYSTLNSSKSSDCTSP